jgi:hypothetical protein
MNFINATHKIPTRQKTLLCSSINPCMRHDPDMYTINVSEWKIFYDTHNCCSFISPLFALKLKIYTQTHLCRRISRHTFCLLAFLFVDQQQFAWSGTCDFKTKNYIYSLVRTFQRNLRYTDACQNWKSKVCGYIFIHQRVSLNERQSCFGECSSVVVARSWSRFRNLFSKGEMNCCILI